MDLDPAPAPPTTIDLTLLLAARAWSPAEADDLWDRFPTARQTTLRWAWSESLPSGVVDPLARLRDEHAAQVRPDLARVHSSWWARALKDEPSSIQRSVVANLPPGLAEVLREALHLEGPSTPTPPLPGVPEVALALWTLRLVGDVPDRDDDPPVIAALTHFDGATVSRLLQAIGLAKWAVSEIPPPDMTPRDGSRLDHFRQSYPSPDPRYTPVARQDVESLKPGDPHAVSRLGMTTIARLLNAADPYRVRWTLQHLPYTTSQVLRTLMGPPGRRAPMLVRWETQTLHAAWLLLQQEGWINEPWGALP